MSLKTMQDTWFYRSLRGEIGPVNLAELRRLSRAGKLDADGEVCSKANRSWRRVDTVEELADEPEELHDLAELNFHFEDRRSAPPRKQPTRPQDIDSLNDLNIEIVSDAGPTGKPTPAHKEVAADETWDEHPVISREIDRKTAAPTTSKRPAAVSKPAPAAGGPKTKSNRWYCLMKGVEYGPFGRANIESMARLGRIQPNTKIRCGDEGEWVSAKQVLNQFNVASKTTGDKASSKRVRSTTTSFARRLSVTMARPKTILLQLALLLTVAAVAYGVVYRVRDIPNDELYMRTELILARHTDLQRARNSKEQGKRKKLIEDAESIRREFLPVLTRTASSLRPHRQPLLIAIRDHLLPMVRNNKDAAAHENAFIEEFKKAKRMWLDPRKRTHIEPTTGESKTPQKTKQR